MRYCAISPRTFILSLAIIISLLASQHIVRAYGERDLLLINLGIPALKAAYNADRKKKPIIKAVVQALFGGYIMYQGFKLAPRIETEPAWRAWQAKLMVNFGASVAESAGEEFVYRMDIGPVWLIADKNRVYFKPAINATVAPLVHLAEGSRFNWRNSLKYGTMAFERSSRRDGTINQAGALAYSNANTFTTNENGNHAGHELVHTLQYRRAAIDWPNVSYFLPEAGRQIGDGWLDDTNWSFGWGLQCAIADMNGQSKDFDIPMEKEAYYLERKYIRPY
ncbi:MAG: hypothetical protein AB1403_11110 [Candidatus Riflebacteria bacterium]